MSRLRKLTRAEKESLSAKGFESESWLFAGEVLDEESKPTSFFKAKNRVTGKVVLVDRNRRKSRW